jgi:LuxR family maltose regulon positive regulatory protein
VTVLHATAAKWFAEHGYPIEAIRHAQAAENWSLAARLLSDQWFALYLDGHAATAHELLAAFPAGPAAADVELTALMAADNLSRGALQEAERYLTLATGRSGSVPADRRHRFQVTLAVLRLQLARQRGDLGAVADEATRLLAAADAPETVQLQLGEDLRAVALINLGIAALWTNCRDDADRHLGQGIALAHRIERPYLELTGLAHGTLLAISRSYALAAQRSMQAIALADRHGWAEEPIVGVAYLMLGGTMVGQGRLEEAERWLGRAARALRAEVEPTATVTLHNFRGVLELASGRYQEALSAFETAERLARLFITPFPRVMRVMRFHVVCTLVQMGDTERAEKALAEADDQERDDGYMRLALAMVRLAQDDPLAAAALARSASTDEALAGPDRVWGVQAVLLEAIACDALGDAGAAERALERALDLAEPDSILLPFLLRPTPELLQRHHRRRTAHAGLVSDILDALAGSKPSRRGELERLREPLTESEVRVLRYLPTNLSQPEIAAELSLSVNTVNTHIRHLYAKLGAHRRGEAVARARDLGLLARSSRERGEPPIRDRKIGPRAGAL